MTAAEYFSKVQSQMEWEQSMVGEKVMVCWGHGRGFRACGDARVVRVNEKSIRVELTDDVVDVETGRSGWKKGLQFSVARRTSVLFNAYNGIFPL